MIKLITHWEHERGRDNHENRKIDKKLFKQEVLNNLKTQFRVELDNASQQQIYQAVAYALKEWIIEDWMDTQKTYEEKDQRFYIICPWNS